ncbi:MAG: hypothetical protein VW644_07495 [Alphaproteobacteria bacterium]
MILRKLALLAACAVLVVGALYLATVLTDSTPFAVAESSTHDPGCEIKGNIDRAGNRVYHVPGGQYYVSVVVDAAAGERWFCSIADAEAAGWRKSPR